MSRCLNGPLDRSLGFGSHSMMPMPSVAGRKNQKQLVLDTTSRGSIDPAQICSFTESGMFPGSLG